MIQTESIIKTLEIIFNKDIKLISESELKTVKKISIEKIGYDGSFLNVTYSDLLLFETPPPYGKQTNRESEDLCGTEHRSVSPKSYKQSRKAKTKDRPE